MPEQRSRPTLGADLILLSITALWGLTFVTVKDALEGADPLTFLALRFGVGAVAAFALAGRRALDPAAWRAGGVLGVFLFVGYAFQTFGLVETTPSRSAFLTGLTVIFVPFVSTALTRRWPPASAFLGTALAVLGLWRMTGVSLDGPLPRGDLLTLGCSVAYAFHITLTERFASRAAPIAIVAVQLLVTATLSALAIPLGSRHFEPTPGLWAAVLLTGILASAVAISVQTWAQARTTAVRASLVFSTEPVFAAAYSAVLGRERLGVAELLGGGLILLGVVVAELGPQLAAAVGRRGRS